MAKRYDLVIIGMGSGGLTAAQFAATLDLRVAAVERDRIGGDCLWTGCVPSKTLLASAKVAHQMRTADRYGLPPIEPEIDASAVWERIHSVREEIASTDDSAERFEAMGVEVVHGPARLTGANTVSVNGRTLETRFILICTGSRPSVPPIPGLEEAGFLSSETVFELDNPPRSIVIIGGGPIAVELAQGLNRLGIKVKVVEMLPRLLPRDEPELTERLTRKLEAEGVEVFVDATAQRVVLENGMKVVHGTAHGDERRWEAEEVLVAAGRKPAVEGLGLEEVGIRIGRNGIETDGRGRTTVASVYATGDVAGRFIFTHWAAYESAMAVRNMFFPGRTKHTRLVPWCTFTDPELAHVGLTTAEAIERYGPGRVEVRRADLVHSDRARAEAATDGAMVIVIRRGRIVGAHVLAPAAGEIINELALAIRERVRHVFDLTNLIHAYPTFATSFQVLCAEAAYERVQRYGWLVRRARDRS